MSGWNATIQAMNATDRLLVEVERLRAALAAEQAKLEKAREALTSLKEYVGSSLFMIETEIISQIDTTLKDIA